jgi:hypothetical protein
MSGGDGRTESRFRGSYEPNRLPRVAGLCRYCHRQMWTSLPERDRRGKIVVSRDGRTCDPCQRYVRTTGKDPREKAGSAAEMVPAEYPEDDQWWRDSGLPHCAGVGGGPFEPDPLPEELAATPDEERLAIAEMRRYIAAFVCGPCPVAEECRAAARVHGYEGMWGGRFFTRQTWTDPLTGLRGPTMHAREPLRLRLTARLAERGYDADGEPLTEDAAG